MSDIYTIDPQYAAAAATTLATIIVPIGDFSTYLATCDRGGAELAPASTSGATLLDEIVEELGLLSELFRIRADLARAADGFSGLDPAAIAALLDRFSDVFAALTGSVVDGAGMDSVPFAPQSDWTSADVADWWASLTDIERAQLTQLAPISVGNTNGIPFDDRISANRIAMQTLIDAGAHDQRLDQFLDKEDPTRIDPKRYIVLFDPTNDGFAAEVFGDLTTATSLAVLVPGMGSGLGNFGTVSTDAYRLWNRDPSMAVIAWSGYDAPKGLAASVDPRTLVGRNAIALFEVATEEQARTGGRQLADFTDAVRLDTEAALTVIGHSYGSLTLGHAIEQGLTADRVLFIGSPGVGVDDVGQFPDGAVGEYFAAKVHGDPVADMQRFGDAPTDPDFGAHVYDAGEPNGIELMLHSEYFDDGTAIDNMRTVVRGGDPSDDRSPLINYITEPYSDLDLPGLFDDIPTGIVDNAGAHLEEVILDGAGQVRKAAVETADDLKNVGVAGATVFVDVVSTVGETAEKLFDPATYNPFG